MFRRVAGAFVGGMSCLLTGDLAHLRWPTPEHFAVGALGGAFAVAMLLCESPKTLSARRPSKDVKR